MPRTGADPFGMAKPRPQANGGTDPSEASAAPSQPRMGNGQAQPHAVRPLNTSRQQAVPPAPQHNLHQLQDPYSASQLHGYAPAHSNPQAQYQQTTRPVEDARIGSQPVQYQTHVEDHRRQIHPIGHLSHNTMPKAHAGLNHEISNVNEQYQHAIQYPAQHAHSRSRTHAGPSFNPGILQPESITLHQPSSAAIYSTTQDESITVPMGQDDFGKTKYQNTYPPAPESSDPPTHQEHPLVTWYPPQDQWARWGGQEEAMKRGNSLHQRKKTERLSDELRSELSDLVNLFQTAKKQAKTSSPRHQRSEAAARGPPNPPLLADATQQALGQRSQRKAIEGQKNGSSHRNGAALNSPSNPLPLTDPALLASGMSQQQHQEFMSNSHTNGANRTKQNPLMSRHQFDQRYNWLSDNFTKLTEDQKEELKQMTKRKRNPERYQWVEDNAPGTSGRHTTATIKSGQGSGAMQDGNHSNHPIYLGQEALRAQQGTRSQIPDGQLESPIDMLKYQKQSGLSKKQSGQARENIPQQPNTHQQNAMLASSHGNGLINKKASARTRKPADRGSKRTALAAVRQWSPSPPPSPSSNQSQCFIGAGREYHANMPPNSQYQGFPSAAGQKRHSDSINCTIEISDEAPIVHQAKRVRTDNAHPSSFSQQKQPEWHQKQSQQQQEAAGQSFAATPAPQNWDTQTTITVPIGNIPPATAQLVIQQALHAYQSGVDLVTVQEGNHGLVVPANSEMTCRPPGSNVVFYGKSGLRNYMQWPTMAAESYAAGFSIAVQHQDLLRSGVPLESISSTAFDARDIPSMDEDQVPIDPEVGDIANFSAEMQLKEDVGLPSGMTEVQPIVSSGLPPVGAALQEPANNETAPRTKGGDGHNFGHATNFQGWSSNKGPANPGTNNMFVNGHTLQALAEPEDMIRGSLAMSREELHDQQSRNQQTQIPRTQELPGYKRKGGPVSEHKVTDKGRAEFERTKALLDGSSVPIAAPLDGDAVMTDDEDDNSLFGGGIFGSPVLASQDDQRLQIAPHAPRKTSVNGNLVQQSSTQALSDKSYDKLKDVAEAANLNTAQGSTPASVTSVAAVGALIATTETEKPASTQSSGHLSEDLEAAVGSVYSAKRKLASPGRKTASLEPQTQPTMNPANSAQAATHPPQDTNEDCLKTPSPVQEPPVSREELGKQEEAGRNNEDLAWARDAVERANATELNKATEEEFTTFEQFVKDHGGLSPINFDDLPTAHDEADLPE